MTAAPPFVSMPATPRECVEVLERAAAAATGHDRAIILAGARHIEQRINGSGAGAANAIDDEKRLEQMARLLRANPRLKIRAVARQVMAAEGMLTQTTLAAAEDRLRVKFRKRQKEFHEFGDAVALPITKREQSHNR